MNRPWVPILRPVFLCRQTRREEGYFRVCGNDDGSVTSEGLNPDPCLWPIKKVQKAHTDWAKLGRF